MIQISPWTPPLSLYAAGHQTQRSRDYVNVVSSDQMGPRRILIKHSLRGEGVIYVGEQRFVVPAGHLFIIERPGPYRYCYEGDGEPWEFQFISLYCASEFSLLPNQIAVSQVVDSRARPQIATELHQLIEAFNKGQQTGLRESLMGYQLYVHCIEAARGRGEGGSKAAHLQKKIRQHFRQDISLAHYAKELGMTHEALTRSFKQEFGLAPSQFIIQLRLRRARRLLEAGKLSLAEIASDCGFSSANYFGRVFKAEIGQSPAAYRRNPNVMG